MGDDQPGSTSQPSPPTPSDEEVIQSLVGTVSHGDVNDLVNKIVGDSSYSRSDGRPGETR